MNIANIRCLAEAGHGYAALQKAEQALIEGRIPEIDVPGDTVDDKLTTLLAACWMIKHMETTGCTSTMAMRDYIAMVRRSISS